MTNKKEFPDITTQANWQKQLAKLREKEKAAMRANDKLSAERRLLPMYPIQKNYEFVSENDENSKVSLLDLFESRSQLLVYHFMYHAEDDSFCEGCSLVIDQISHLAHLHARNTSFTAVARAPIASIKRHKKRMGWQVPWVSSLGSDFNDDFGVTTPGGEMFGLSVFFCDQKDGNKIYRSYFTEDRGIEAIGTVWSMLDITPWGRQETWEDSPEHYSQTEPYGWWRLHDEYTASSKFL